jgi:hypothetical protein
MISAATAFAARRRSAAGRAAIQAISLHWWARPHLFVLLFQVPVFVICARLPHEMFLNWKHAQNFITADAFAVALTAMTGFAVAVRLASHISARHSPAHGVGMDRLVGRTQYRSLVYCLLGVTLAAYAMLLAPAISDPAATAALFAGGIDALEMRERLGQVPGITSLVNLGPLYVTLLFSQANLTGFHLTRFDKFAFLVFLLFVIARVFLWSERLALLEVLVPIAIMRLAAIGRHRFLVASLPVIAVLGLGMFFGVTEYFRSWTIYSDTGISLLDFVVTRLIGYYATSINNGAIIIEAFEPQFIPYNTAAWFFKFPLIYDPTAGAEHYGIAFRNFGNPEFNNTSGVFAPASEFGAFAGIMIWIGLGAVTGRLFAGFVTGRLFSVLLFPTWMIGVYEMLRIFYWGDPRYFPVLVVAPAIAWLLARSVVRQPVPHRLHSSYFAGLRR